MIFLCAKHCFDTESTVLLPNPTEGMFPNSLREANFKFLQMEVLVRNHSATG